VFWLIIWLVLALAIIVLTFWTYAILLKQKSVWKAFAVKNKLTVRKNRLLQSPDIEGMYKGLLLQVFSERQGMPDGRGVQFRTIIQFVLKPNMPTEGVIASRHFTPFVTNLALPKKWALPKDMKWKEQPLARAGVSGRLDTFLTAERLKALETVSNMQRSNFVFIFDETDAYLRVESPDPLDNLERMDKIIRKIFTVAEALTVKDEELDKFNELAGREESFDSIHEHDNDDLVIAEDEDDNASDLGEEKVSKNIGA
tara:strand:+ start:9199 stop:9966 length:768 start_codon:yes stop_codon:yes gene_type:complete